jgi:hypothetical protein
MKMVTFCVQNVGNELKIILQYIFVPVTIGPEMLSSHTKDRIRNTDIGMSFDDSFVCSSSTYSVSFRKGKRRDIWHLASNDIKTSDIYYKYKK